MSIMSAAVVVLRALLMPRGVIIAEWACFDGGSADIMPERIQEFIEWAWIGPEDHPRTHPMTKVTKLPSETVEVGGKELMCDVLTFDVMAEFPDWGRDLNATLVTHSDLPGMVAKMAVSSHKGEQPFEFIAQVVDYHVVSE